MRDSTSESTLSPKKHGVIHGKFIPSPLGSIRIEKPNGQVVELKMNRAQRRRFK